MIHSLVIYQGTNRDPIMYRRPSIRSLQPSTPKKVDWRAINPQDFEAFEEIQEEEEVYLLRTNKVAPVELSEELQ